MVVFHCDPLPMATRSPSMMRARPEPSVSQGDYQYLNECWLHNHRQGLLPLHYDHLIAILRDPLVWIEVA